MTNIRKRSKPLAVNPLKTSGLKNGDTSAALTGKIAGIGHACHSWSDVDNYAITPSDPRSTNSTISKLMASSVWPR